MNTPRSSAVATAAARAGQTEQTTSTAASAAAQPARPARRRRPRRLIARAITLTLATAGAGVAMAAPALASWYPATVGHSGVNVRDCYHPTIHLPPSTNCTYQATLSPGTGVHIVCQRAGQNINGDNVWDYVTYAGGEGFASDYYIYTGYASWIPGIQICH